MLTKLTIQGFKSIRDLDDFELGSMNILIGANGAGKSNLISFFRMLNYMTPRSLQFYVGKYGGANALLHKGALSTPQMKACLTFQTDSGVNDYEFRLFHAAPDTLIFADERFRFTRRGLSGRNWNSLGSGHREANIILNAEQGDRTARVILSLMKECVVHQFHNTSELARIRQRWDVYDNRFLKEDGANLAPLLLRLRDEKPRYYTRIVDAIRQITPFFVDFVLEPVGGTVMLQWRERETDMIFGAHQASDGMLRIMALVTLLLQPENELPDLLLFDEPELGLHPFAIHILAGLLQSLPERTQVILSTQSSTLVNYFRPSQIVVVDRVDQQSSFTRLSEEKLRDWLEDYSLAELWEKNVLGGRPA